MSAAFLAITLVGAIPLASFATDENYALTIPGQGWTIAFNAPPLLEFQGQSKGKSFVFQANDQRAFNISLFVEAPKTRESTNGACFDFYWPRAKRNPMIDQSTIRIDKSSKKFIKVTYQIKADGSTALNANYYFAFHDRWADLHVSRFPSAPDDEKKLATFESSIAYEITKDKSK